MSTYPPTLNKSSAPAAATEHDALPAGTRFGEFEILRVLGVGGFVIVYLAQDHSLERQVALKEYMPASLAARGAGPQITVRSASFAETYAIGLRSFINEARLLARFDHPSLVKVYRFWEDNATAYMVMPYLQGVTLRDMRRRMSHPPDEPWIKSVIMPILSALELLHREGVYHRDIAPDNILLPPDGPPVLLDFGAARRVISDRTQSLTAILKPSYAPIEQYAEMTQLRQGPWTDLYALGAVIHYLLFGVPPAPATARAVQDDVDAIDRRVVPGISARFMEAMAWMLAIRPNERPQSGEQVRAVLDGLAEVPPRGLPGITLPSAVGRQVRAGAATQLHVRPADTTSIDQAFLPTYMPAAPADARTTTFSPETQMPTARQVPVGATTPQTVVTPQPQKQPPTAVTSFPATSAAPVASRAMTQPPPVTARAPTRVEAPAAAAVGVAAAAPVDAGPPSQSFAPPRHAPLPAESRPAGSKAWLAAIAAGGVGIVAIAFAGWQYSARPAAQTAAVDPVASAAAATATANAVPAIPEARQPTAAATPGAVTFPIGSATAPATIGGIPIEERSAPMSGAPVTALPSARPPTAQTTSAAVAAGMAASLLGNATSRPVPPAGDASMRSGTTSRDITDLSAASGARVRPTGRQARSDDLTPSTGGMRPVDRAAMAVNPGSLDASRLGSGTSARDLLANQRGASIAEDEPSSVREACGKRGFISMAICMDAKCEEPRYRATAECIGVLSRKTARENR